MRLDKLWIHLDEDLGTSTHMYPRSELGMQSEGRRPMG